MTDHVNFGLSAFEINSSSKNAFLLYDPIVDNFNILYSLIFHILFVSNYLYIYLLFFK